MFYKEEAMRGNQIKEMGETRGRAIGKTLKSQERYMATEAKDAPPFIYNIK